MFKPKHAVDGNAVCYLSFTKAYLNVNVYQY